MTTEQMTPIRVCRVCGEELVFNEVIGGLGWWGHIEARDRGKRSDHIAQPTVLTDLISSGEVAQMLGVDRRTITRWASEGTIKPDIVTPGGHRRYSRERIESLRDEWVAAG